jgi:hypothetical protein
MSRAATLLALLVATTTMACCEAIATIFEAGFWVGIIVVVIVIALIAGVVRMLGGGRRS